MHKVGLNDDQLEYFCVHIENDPGHGADALQHAVGYVRGAWPLQSGLKETRDGP